MEVIINRKPTLKSGPVSKYFKTVHTTASNTTMDDVTNQVTYTMFNTNS